MFNLGNWANIITFCHESLGITKWMILLKYFDMWSDWIWFMWSYGRLCLIWPITDGLACSMLLFPQRHSHNPSLRAEPWAYSYDMLCLPVCGRANSCVHVVGNVKNTSIWASLHVHMQTYVRCYPYKCTFFFLSLYGNVNSVRFALFLPCCKRYRQAHWSGCNWRSIQTRVLSSHFTVCFISCGGNWGLN